MSDPAVRDDASDGQIRPDLKSFVADDLAFRQAVHAGVASLAAEPTYDLATIVAELQDMIHGQG